MTNDLNIKSSELLDECWDWIIQYWSIQENITNYSDYKNHVQNRDSYFSQIRKKIKICENKKLAAEYVGLVFEMSDPWLSYPEAWPKTEILKWKDAYDKYSTQRKS